MFWQLAYNTLLTAGEYVLLAMAFFVVMAACRFFHFVVALPAVVAPFLIAGLVPPDASLATIMSAAVLLPLVLGALGAGLHCLVFLPLQRRGATVLQLTIVSLVLLFIGQHTLGLIVSGRTVRLAYDALDLGSWPAGSVVFNYHQILSFTTAMILAGACLLCWRISVVGLAFRAVQENEQTAATMGVPVQAWRAIAVAIGCILSALAGVTRAVDNHVGPEAGFDAAFLGIACVIIGGRTTIWQPLLGVLVISVARNIIGYWAASNWEPSLTFGICLLALLLSPEWNRAQPATG